MSALPSVVVDQVMSAINPYGLHLAFLDPFNLAQLPFRSSRKLLRVKRMDMIIHVSVQDLQRNLDDYTRASADRSTPLRRDGGMQWT